MPAFYDRTKLKGTVKNSGDHVRGMDFDCEVGGLSVGGMVKVSGIRFEYEVTPYKHAESKNSHCRPGHPKRGSLELHREFSGKDMTYRTWRQTINDGKTDRRTVTVKLKADDGSVVKTYDFFNAWPSEYHPPAITATASAHAVERIVLNFEEWKIS
jgi:phage tail-like protein